MSAGLTADEVEAEYVAGVEARRRALRDRRLQALTLGGVGRRRPLMDALEDVYTSLRVGVPLPAIACRIRRIADDVDAAEADRLRRRVQAVEAPWRARR